MIYDQYISPFKRRKLSFSTRRYPRNIMWLYMTFLLIIGTTTAEHNNAWETGNEYHFLIQSRTLTALHKLSDQVSGILIKGDITIQVKSTDTLHAVVSNTQYAPVHKVLPGDLDSEITDLEYRELSLSGKPFEIKLQNGLIQDVLIDQDVSTWEVNLLKSFLSQLQIDTQGENVIASRDTQMLDDSRLHDVFEVMEDSVGGKCEVRYIISPLSEKDLSENPEYVPLPNLRKDGHHIEVIKMKDYNRCEQRMAYHSGIVGRMAWEPRPNDDLFWRLSSSHIIISGNLKRFTIQSSVTSHEIFVRSKIERTYSGAVYSRVNLTLDRMSTVSNLMPVSNNLMSTGNLVYIYNSPFSDQHTPRRPSEIRNFLAARTSEKHISKRSSESHGDDDDRSNLNSEERDYFQPKPKLEDAPEIPLLPYFVGYNGSSILKSEKNFTAITCNLITWIIQKIETYGSYAWEPPLLDMDLLEKYMILIRLMRTMNVAQITEIEETLAELIARDSSRGEEKKILQHTVWDVLRNAIAHVGTGPALITVKNWIKDKKVEGKQAAGIISQIPKAALTPTPEYIREFFELITDEQVRKQKILNTTAPVAFAELVHNTHNNMSSRYYPVYSFGRMVPKNDSALLEIYIPYMATQLREAIEEGHNPRIQTYIMALGGFGHPKILSIFEPYLEGTLPISKFQRLMMVISLNKLGENFPRLARSVANKIYINTMEAYELRCAAVYVIMKTNPPLSLLQRMAEFTHQDQDKQVNSAVTTSIEGLANSKEPEFKELADKARIARKLLKPSTYTKDYSHSILQEITIASLNIAQRSFLETIASDDSTMFKGLHLNSQQSYGNFKFPSGKATFAISNTRGFLDMWYQMPWMKRDNIEKKLIIEDTIEKLGIKSEDPEQIEWSVFEDSVFATKFYAFDNHTFDDIANMFTRYVESLKSSREFETGRLNYLYCYDTTLGFPTESGLPFSSTLAASQFIRIASAESHKNGISPTMNYTDSTVMGHIVYTEKIESRVGFVAPFEHRHYIAGIDINTEFFVPAGLRYISEGKKIVPNVLPKYYQYVRNGPSAVYHSVVPYTARHDILSFSTNPSSDTRVVNTKEPHTVEFSLDTLMSIQCSVKSDHIDEETSKKTGLEAAAEIINVFRKGGPYYRKFLALFDLHTLEVNITSDTFRQPYRMFDTMYDIDASSEATIPAIMNKQPESEARREQFLREVNKDVDAAVSYVYDISILTSERINYVFTLALANNRANNKFQTLLYWNAQDPRSGEVSQEFCAIGNTKSSQITPLSFNKAIEKIPKNEFKIEVRFGNCTNGETIGLKGNLTRSNDFKERAMKSEIVKKCQEEIKQGNVWLPICRDASESIRQKDHLTMSIDSKRLSVLASTYILNARKKDQDLEDFPNTELTDENTVDVDMKALSDNNSIISLRAMGFTFSVPDISDQKLNTIKILNKLFKEDSEGSTCVLDKTQVVTFDEKVYPVKLGDCWHVLMTTYPKRDPNNPEETLSIPKYMSTIVMAREMDDGSKQIQVIFGDDKIHLYKSGNSFGAAIGDQIISFASSNSSGFKSFRENNIEIYRLDDTITIFSLEYGIRAVYDGERILLRATHQYLSAVRGLCGNYDMRSGNDFIVPKNCILTKPEEFAATYALTQEYCQGPALENKQKAEQSTCTPRSYQPSDVISDIEAGRSATRNRRWGYH
ncbi:PREDICTED: vitellogenin-1-like [Vollenhovia emeryi]|uniref:vitellogenin-1-like n=1 Tax=Vollenhovia emeryi TaxID=411798 RepID=UPI0005F58957|nr:PREDICTED: vitellogenin-1-like [Vollenhovia emeryi]